MTLKFTPQQALHVFNLFNNVVLPDSPGTLQERLIMLHMLSIYRKLRAKLEGGYKYNISVTEAEALAYWCYFKGKDLSLYPYESNAIQGQILDIDKALNTNVYAINPNKIKLLN